MNIVAGTQVNLHIQGTFLTSVKQRLYSTDLQATLFQIRKS